MGDALVTALPFLPVAAGLAVTVAVPAETLPSLSRAALGAACILYLLAIGV